jgi:hypothetical protein
MAELSIDRLKGALTGGGARANYFEVIIPTLGGSLTAEEGFLVKAAQLPASIIAPITVPFRGRQLQIAGDRTFEPWTITVLNDTNFAIRNKMEEWMNAINQHASNKSSEEEDAYYRDAIVRQLDRQGNEVKTYNFIGIWPSNVSSIDVSYDSENTIEEFTVEFQVTYWTSDTTDTAGTA